jgi:hypothetical protein
MLHPYMAHGISRIQIVPVLLGREKYGLNRPADFPPTALRLLVPLVNALTSSVMDKLMVQPENVL